MKNSHKTIDHKRLDFNLEIKRLDAHGRFAGYASVFDIIDSQRDIVVRGAFRKTLTGRTADIKLLWQHNTSEPIGIFTSIFEDAHGLYVEGKLLLDVTKAREAYSLLKAGVLKGLSIGYTPKKFSVEPKSGVRKITEMELWEISLVTFPANPSAEVTIVKSDENAEWNHARRTGELIQLSDAINRAKTILLTTHQP